MNETLSGMNASHPIALVTDRLRAKMGEVFEERVRLVGPLRGRPLKAGGQEAPVIPKRHESMKDAPGANISVQNNGGGNASFASNEERASGLDKSILDFVESE